MRAVVIAPLLALSLALVGCGQPVPEGEAMASADAPLPGQAAFSQCAACHVVSPGRNGVGPNLHGVVGRRAGTVAGYGYSPAMLGSAQTWDRASLDRYLADPQAVVPGTRMAWTVADATQRTQLIDYLETLR